MKKINIAEDSISTDRILTGQTYPELLFALIKPIGSIDDKGCLIIKSDNLSEVIRSIHYHDRYSKLTSVIVDIDFIYGDVADAINFGFFVKEFCKPVIIRTNHIGAVYDTRFEYYQRYARRPQDSANLPDYNYPLPKYKKNIDWLAVASKATDLMKAKIKNDFNI